MPVAGRVVVIDVTFFAGVILWGLVQLRLGWTAYFFATEMDLVRWGCFLSILFLAFQLSGVTGRARAFRTENRRRRDPGALVPGDAEDLGRRRAVTGA